jgi:O-antigen ligase
MKNLGNILSRWLVYALVFLLPWQTRWIVKLGELNRGIWEYGTYSIYAWDIILIVAVALVWLRRRDQLRAKTSYLDFAIWSLLGMGALSFFWAVNRGLALFALWKMAEGGLLMWLVGAINLNVRNMARWFAAGAAVQAVFGLIQFITQQTWANKWFGLAVHDPGQLGTIVVETDQLRILRAYAALPHPNMLGGLLVVGIIIIFGLYFDLFRRITDWWQRVEPKKHSRKLWRQHRLIITGFITEIVCYLTALILMTAGLMVSFSRSAAVGLVVGLGVMGGYTMLKSRAFRRAAFAKLAVIVVLTVGITIAIFPQPWLSRMQTGSRLEQQSINTRETYQEQAVHLFKNYWLVGTGLGNYTAGLHEKYVNLEPWAYQPVHNILFLAAVELGWLGIIVFGFLIYELFRRMSRGLIRNHPDNVWMLTSSAALISLMIIGLFDHYLWSLHFGIMLWWLVVGMARRTTA